MYIYMYICDFRTAFCRRTIESHPAFPVGKNLCYRHRCVFAWRHLEAGQYVAQSGLHLHHFETHSCKGNDKVVVSNLEIQVDLPSH